MTEPIFADPPSLRAHAKLLTADAEDVTELRSYADRHCADTEGLTGAMWVMVPPLIKGLQEVQHRTTDTLRRGFTEDAAALEATAAAYERSDQDAAERIWASTDMRGGNLPVLDPHHPGDFTNPAAIGPLPPVYKDEMGKKIEEVYGFLRAIDRWIEKIVRFSVFEDLAPYLIGDWGKVHQLSRAYEQLGGEAGTQGVDRNVLHGIDSLDPFWNGPAAQTFEARYRLGWHQALNTWTRINATSKEVLETVAQAAEQAFVEMKVAVISALMAIGAMAARFLAAVAVGTPVAAVAGLASNIYRALEKLVHLWEAVVDVFWGRCKVAYQAIEALWELTKLMADVIGGAGTAPA